MQSSAIIPSPAGTTAQQEIFFIWWPPDSYLVR